MVWSQQTHLKEVKEEHKIPEGGTLKFVDRK